ncbi:MAG: 1-acyl-sn-glycerol-3-phosphate acyltransferase [Actinobacteria bacterium]|nr:1-acyl-sn-glycerol-3-phosphate acyltransferase [Actinomycetota bacterium]
MADVESFLAGGGLGSRAFYRIVRNLLTFFSRTFWRTSVIGRGFVPRSGPFILAPVHRSNIDTPLVCAVTRRRMRYMGKDSLWRKRPVGWVLSALGGFPVSRGTADREALRRCIEVLEAGEPLVLFPEGERKSGETVQPLFDGVTYIAMKAGVPVIPVGIGGSERAMPKGKRYLRPSKCVILVGEPMMPPSGEGRASRSVVRDFSANLHAVLQRLFDEAQVRAGARTQ